ncbi:hypothetical protein EF096_06170 [Pseudomonas neustonica]|uniref:AAA+ ATPase domain-containing protein n=1 Tax=Pseudomonas neustonica TaxID=2487346 RepID=A0ABX9XJL1_9PSED|nr:MULTISPECIES: ExeA family protein [Pseudomonas]ROZ84518.1 hypothetical protein EF099_06580 [Pseudomonas sp. SSM44]ROZ86321.1 hypothetical protein EF096_06170 [Pseudomonas neustonica]|tara:strand:- start:9354 stop:10820 length:1467 start_codon:yes stop_codon:yes gene_type:complete
MNASVHLSAYLQHFGFVRNPFPVTPDEHGIFFSPRLAQQFTELVHFIEQRKGFMLVTGDVGVGKSTLSRALLTRLAGQGTRTALVFNTFLQGPELLRAINRDFGIEAQGDSLESLLQALNDWLLQQRDAGHNCVLILDDAQGLDVSSLELVRQLSNLEASQAKLLQIVMVAQPEISLTLDRYDMRQLASRIALRLELSPLTLSELDTYLHHRLQWAGSPQALTLDQGALRRLHYFSHGYIRRVHILVDRCLYGLAASDSSRITAALVNTAAYELGFQPQAKRNPGVYAAKLVAGVAAIGVIAGLVVLDVRPDWAVIKPVPAVASVAPVAVAKVEAEPEPQALAWQQFIDRYAPLAVGEAPPEHWSQVIQWLPERSDTQPWLAVLLPLDWQEGCHGQTSYPLSEGNLVLFRSALPAQPQPFGADDSAIIALQQSLAQQGLLAEADIDGVMGPRTATALAFFQKQNDLLATGQPDADTAYLLDCIGGASE